MADRDCQSRYLDPFGKDVCSVKEGFVCFPDILQLWDVTVIQMLRLFRWIAVRVLHFVVNTLPEGGRWWSKVLCRGVKARMLGRAVIVM